jgi:hypothetical protein
MYSIEEQLYGVMGEIASISAEVDRSLDRYEQCVEGACASRAVFEAGLLLACVREARAKAEKLSRRIPSPNRVPVGDAEAVAALSSALFRFMESCDSREVSINEMVLGPGREIIV